MKPSICLAAVLSIGLCTSLPALETTVNIGAAVHDAVIDPARNLVYVSVPSLNRVVFVSMLDWSVTDSVNLIGPPRGMDLSVDGQTLFAAINADGRVAFINLNTKSVTTISVQTQLEDGRTWDVAATSATRLYVSANPGSSGFAKVVQVQLNNNNAASIVADNRIIRGAPNFAADRANQFLYVSESFSPNSLYKLDLSQRNAPIILEDEHGSVSGTQQAALDPSGGSIYLGSGQVLGTGNFVQNQQILFGRPAFGDSPGVVYSYDSNRVRAYETANYRQIGDRLLTTTFSSVSQFLILPGGNGWIVAGDSKLAVRTDSQFCTAAPPLPDQPAPANSLQNVTVGTSLQWRDTGSGCLTHYDVYFGDSNPPSQLLSDDGDFPVCTPPLLQPETTYFWRVVASNDIGTTQGPVWSFRTGRCPIPTAPTDVSVPFTTDPWDAVVDAQRRLIYVSLPLQNELAIVSSQTLQVVRRLHMAPGPRGLDISLDGTRLFIARNGATGVTVLNLETLAQTHISAGPLIEDYHTWDVIEAQPNRLFVSASPGSGGFAKIVQILLNQGNAVSVVASNRIIRASPTFEVGPQQTSLYVSEGFSPNSLYRLDLQHVLAPIVAEDDHGAVSGTSLFQPTPDGVSVVLSSGQVLNAQTLDVVSSIQAGIPRLGSSPSVLWTATAPNFIRRYGLPGFSLIDSMSIPNSISTLRQFRVLPQDAGIIAIGSSKLIYHGYEALPSIATLISPENGATESPLNTQLSWSDGDNGCVPARFDVYFGVTNPPTNLLCSNTQLTTCNPGPLNYNATYYWQVIARNSGGANPGPVWQFDTEACAVPQAPHSPVPAHLATQVLPSTSLMWNAAPLGSSLSDSTSVSLHDRSGMNSSCTTSYSVYFGTSSPPANLICSGISAPSCDPGPLASATTYYWRVVSSTPVGDTSGPIWSFTTIGDFRYGLVVRSTPSTHERGALPGSIGTCIGKTKSFVVEYWATDSGELNSGVACAFADLSYPTNVSLQSIQYAGAFSLLHSGTDNGAGLVNELGGCSLTAGLGVNEWAKVATLHFRADECADPIAFQLSPAAAESSAHGRGLVPAADIEYGAAASCVNEACIYDLNLDGNINQSDLDQFVACFNCAPAQGCWPSGCSEADFDCSGTVGGGDFGWLSGAYASACGSLNSVQLPPCRRCAVGGGLIDEGASLPLQVAWRVSRPGKGGSAADSPSLRSVDEAVANQPGRLDVWVRDPSSYGNGIAAAYLRLGGSNMMWNAASAAIDERFSLMQLVRPSPDGSLTVGGATLDQGVGRGEWVLLASIPLSDGASSSPDNELDISIAAEGIGRVAEGDVAALEFVPFELSGLGQAVRTEGP